MKIPFFDIYIVKGHILRCRETEIIKQQVITRRQQEIIQNERAEKKALHDRIMLEAKMSARQLHQNAVMAGRIKAPLCPKCGRPKIAGGIRWLDHPVGCEKNRI